MPKTHQARVKPYDEWPTWAQCCEERKAKNAEFVGLVLTVVPEDSYWSDDISCKFCKTNHPPHSRMPVLFNDRFGEVAVYSVDIAENPDDLQLAHLDVNA